MNTGEVGYHSLSIINYMKEKYGVDLLNWRDPIMFGTLLSVVTTVLFNLDNIKIVPLLTVSIITAYSIYSIQTQCYNNYTQKLNVLRSRLDTLKDQIYNANNVKPKES